MNREEMIANQEASILALQANLDALKAGGPNDTPIDPPVNPPPIEPPPPGAILVPFSSPFKSVPVPADLPQGRVLQVLADEADVWEIMGWDTRVPITATPQTDGGVIITDNEGTGPFIYAPMCSGKFIDFGDKCLHFRQMVQYHLTDRRLNAFYFMPNDDTDLVEVRTLSEWVPPFKKNGILVFMCYNWWQARVYNSPTELYANNPNDDPDHGFDGSALRASKQFIPTQKGYIPYDNGGVDEYKMMRQIDIYLSQKEQRIKIYEGGNLKVNLHAPVNFSRGTWAPSIGSYHVGNEIGPKQDFATQEAVGNGREQFWDEGPSDSRRFGPPLFEVIDAIPT